MKHRFKFEPRSGCTSCRHSAEVYTGYWLWLGEPVLCVSRGMLLESAVPLVAAPAWTSAPVQPLPPPAEDLQGPWGTPSRCVGQLVRGRPIRRRRAYRRAYVASPRLTTTDVGLTPRLAYARVVHTAPDALLVSNQHCKALNGTNITRQKLPNWTLPFLVCQPTLVG